MRTITHASLFSGIGGAEIAAAWLGWENLFHCDINEFGRKVLGYWFPKSKEYNDIKTTDFTEWRGRVDILTAGFPCQPFSMAGKRRGADDDRYLWPETLRAINEIRPAWFVGENVFGIASMVLPGEEVDMGRTEDLFEETNLYRKEQRYVLDRICQDIEDAGYTVQPVVIPACAVGAPHRRDRVWFVARREGVGHDAEDTDRHGFHRGDGKDEVIADERRVDALGDACEGGPHSSSHTACGVCPPLQEGLGGEGAGERVVSQSAERRGSPDRAGGLAGVPRADAESRCAGLQEEGPELPAAGAAGTLPQVAANPRVFGLQTEGAEREETGTSGILPRPAPYADSGRPEETDERPTEDDEEGLRRDVPGERRIPRFQGWEGFPTQSPVCRGDDGLPFGVADLSIPFGRWRREAIKALGNAWVPEVAYEIFRMIQMVENGDYEQD